MTTIKISDSEIEPLSLAEAKAHLRVTLADPTNDAYIEGLIAVARQAAEDRMQRTVLATAWQLILPAFPRGAITLHRPPIQSVKSIRYIDVRGDERPHSDFLLTPGDRGQLSCASGKSWPATKAQPGAVMIDYIAGFQSPGQVPKPIIQWIKLALTDLYANRSRSAERPALPQEFADGLLSVSELRVL